MEMYPSGYSSRRLVSQQILPSFFLSLLIAGLGVWIGQYVPPALFLPLSIVELIMIFAAVWIRRNRAVGFGFLYSFTFLSGLTIFPAIEHYIVHIGLDNVLKAIGVTIFAFGIASIYAARTKADFQFLGGFLFIGLLTLLGMGIVNIFYPFSRTADLIYSLLGIFIFIGYTLFDISRITRYGVAEEDVPFVVLSLYLDFVNLFLFVLRLMGINLKRD
jgi:FtsH-binding integral membrane protein